jgi:signal transduction histidine kinase/CheY-like chemotaxis protein
MPIFQRLLFAFLAVGLLIAAPLIYVSFTFSSNAAQLRTEQSIEQQVAIITATFEQEFGLGLTRSLKQLSTSETLVLYQSASQTERLVNARGIETSFLRLQTDYPSYSGIYYAEPAGSLIASVEDGRRVRWGALAEGSEAPPTRAHFDRLLERIRTTPTLLSSGNMEWFMPPREITVEGPFRDEKGRLCLLAGLPALDFDNGAVSGVVVIRLSLEGFVGQLRKVRIFDEDPIWLFTPGGTPLVRPAAPRLVLEAHHFGDSRPVAETVFRQHPDGLLAFRDLLIVPGSPFLRLAYAVPDSLLSRDFQSALSFFLAVLLASALGVAVLAYAVARNFSRPLTRLAQAASQLARGELAGRVDVRASGEIRVLVDSFNRMAENLQTANRNRASAFAVLRRTAAQMQTGGQSQQQASPSPDRDSSAVVQEDPGELRAISELLEQLIREREENLRNVRQAKEAAEHADRAKSQFLANMSHEIRTPLNAVLGMLKLLQSTPLTTRQGDYVAKTEGAARSLLLLLNDILDFSKVEADMMSLDPRRFRVDRLLRDLSVILSASVGAKPLEVLFDIDPALPRELIGDDLRLQQVLINLGGNAVKFTDRGEVVIRLRELGRDDTGVLLEFAVSDTGIGIAQAQQAQIFSGFSQAEASTTRRYGGTGLGLAISQRLVELMGGHIGVESEPARGSCFRFAIRLAIAPAVPEDADGPTADEPPLRTRPAGLEHLHVLVVDDNPTALEVLARMARSLGWRVETATGGAEALACARRAADRGDAFDVVFVDWQMPGMDGWETSVRLRESAARGSGASLVMMVTAHGREMLAQHSAQEQASLGGFLVKPVTASMLFDAVADARLADFRPAGTPEHAAPRPGRLEGLRILVVEDNANNRQVAQELLLHEGAIVELADNGERGVATVEAAGTPFDAVLMDLQMPVMDGFTATARLRADPRFARLPIIAMTANALAADRMACLQAGMNDHVGKPFELSDLIATLLRHTGRAPVSPGNDGTALTAELPPVLLAQAARAGIALDAALRRLEGNLAVYARMLRRFAGELPDSLEALRARLVAGERGEAAMLAHGIKGVAGMLGAEGLHTAAGELERMLRAAASDGAAAADPDPLLAAGKRLAEEAPALATALLARCGLPATTGDRSATPGGIVEGLRELRVLLRRSDMSAVDCFERIRAGEGSLGAPFMRELEQAIDALDFQRAGALCEQAIEAAGADQFSRDASM